jgi:hypothetical protein
MNSTQPDLDPDDIDAPVRHGTLEDLLGLLLLPVSLLSTNLTLGLPLPETIPVAFIAVGLLLCIVRRRIDHPGFCLVAGIIGFYGALGLMGPRPIDGLRISCAALVVISAAQITPNVALRRSCAISLMVLMCLRCLSLILPGQFAALYSAMGLRAANLYGGGPAVLFAEPSYLATAVIAMWAIARTGRNRGMYIPNLWIDISSISVLLLSLSASAALYAVVGVIILLRRRPITLSVLIAVVAITLTVAVDISGTRIDVLFNAVSAVLKEGGLQGAFAAFSALDPSSAFRLSMTVLALKSSLIAPFGHLSLEMSRELNSALSQDVLGILSSNELVTEFYGNLQPNTVPLQMLYYGGWLLFCVIAIPAIGAVRRLLGCKAMRPGNYLLIAAILFSCLLQSVLTSPFFYLCLAVGLYEKRPATEDNFVSIGPANA